MFFVGRVLAAGGVIALSACANVPHNNVLLFGTDTKVALDISSAATQGGAPQITLGYRRAEAVWMPLVVNDADCESANGACRIKTAVRTDRKLDANGVPTAVVTEPVQYAGTTTTTKDGTETVSKDSYSVFASFGAKFSGSAAGTDVSGSGGLAQFFATGVAAQKLAENPNVEAALKINNAGAAGAEADAKQAEADAELAKARQEEARAKIAAIYNETVLGDVEKVMQCTGRDAAFDKAKKDRLVAASNLDPERKPQLTQFSGSPEFEQYLKFFEDVAASLSLAATTSSDCQ